MRGGKHRTGLVLRGGYLKAARFNGSRTNWTISRMEDEITRRFFFWLKAPSDTAYACIWRYGAEAAWRMEDDYFGLKGLLWH